MFLARNILEASVVGFAFEGNIKKYGTKGDDKSSNFGGTQAKG